MDENTRMVILIDPLNPLGSSYTEDELKEFAEIAKENDIYILHDITYKDFARNHFLAEKRCILMACAGGTGRGTLECMTQLERGLTHMGIRVYDRIPVVRYNKDYVLPALVEAGKTYVDRLENGFDMYY